jgi:hypothetical protein
MLQTSRTVTDGSLQTRQKRLFSSEDNILHIQGGNTCEPFTNTCEPFTNTCEPFTNTCEPFTNTCEPFTTDIKTIRRRIKAIGKNKSVLPDRVSG